MEPNKTFIIKHKTTGELFQARSGKTSWKAPGHAKSAFNQSVHYIEDIPKIYDETLYWNTDKLRFPRFDEQDIYEIVELKLEASTNLDKCLLLLNECLGRCEYEIHNKIEDFLKEIEDAN